MSSSAKSGTVSAAFSKFVHYSLLASIGGQGRQELWTRGHLLGLPVINSNMDYKCDQQWSQHPSWCLSFNLGMQDFTKLFSGHAVCIFVTIEADPCINDQSGTNNLLLIPPIYDLGLCLPCHGTRRLDFIIRLLEISTFYLHVSLTFPWHSVHTPLLCHEKSIMLYVFSIFQTHVNNSSSSHTMKAVVKWDERSHRSNQFRPNLMNSNNTHLLFPSLLQVNALIKHTPLLLRKVDEC